MQIKGRNLVDGLPKNVTISASEVREALADPLVTIVDAIKSTLEKTPPGATFQQEETAISAI